ncbi:MAG: hypothetical protein RIS94_1978 [Pseudomonadota bacterium]
MDWNRQANVWQELHTLEESVHLLRALLDSVYKWIDLKNMQRRSVANDNPEMRR